MVENNDRGLHNNGSNTHSIEDVSHDPVLRRLVYEEIHHCHSNIEGESFMCDEPASFHESFCLDLMRVNG